MHRAAVVAVFRCVEAPQHVAQRILVRASFEPTSATLRGNAPRWLRRCATRSTRASATVAPAAAGCTRGARRRRPPLLLLLEAAPTAGGARRPIAAHTTAAIPSADEQLASAACHVVVFGAAGAAAAASVMLAEHPASVCDGEHSARGLAGPALAASTSCAAPRCGGGSGSVDVLPDARPPAHSQALGAPVSGESPLGR